MFETAVLSPVLCAIEDMIVLIFASPKIAPQADLAVVMDMSCILFKHSSSTRLLQSLKVINFSMKLNFQFYLILINLVLKTYSPLVDT